MKKTILIITTIGLLTGCVKNENLNNDFVANETNHKCEIKAPKS